MVISRRECLVALFCLTGASGAAELPGRYFRLLEIGIAPLEREWKAREGRAENHYYPGALLASAVLYAKQPPDNHHRSGLWDVYPSCRTWQNRYRAT